MEGLPYFDGTQFQPNDQTANLSDTILRDPLGQPSLPLHSGVHLHWKMPSALSHGNHADGCLTFPQLPNRWLVIYQGDSEQYWVVESDYLHPEGENPENTANIRYNPDKNHNECQPYRYLGRNLSLDDWRSDRGNHQYHDTLTVMGPFNQLKSLDEVNTSFTALYSHSNSVLGLHHDLDVTNIKEGHSYTVIGWYSNSDNDPLKQWLQKQDNTSAEQLVAALKKDFQWDIDLNDQDFPQQSIYYGHLRFANTSIEQPNPSKKFPKPDLTVGNSAAEALSAYLANSIDKDNKSVIEDQLEAIDFLKSLNQQVDIKAKFKEIRHKREFKPVQGATIFAIKSGNEGTSVDAENANPQGLSDLSPDLVSALNTLNSKAQEYYQANQELESQRQILFSDWCKYMKSKYPNEAEEIWPDAEDIHDFINYSPPASSGIQAVYGIQAVQRQTDRVNQLKSDLSSLHSNLSQKLDPYNQKNKTQYILSKLPDLGYWQSNDLVVLMIGDSVKPSAGFSANGDLTCKLLTTDIDLQTVPDDTVTALKTAISGMDSQSNPGIQSWQEQPWNPFLLAWEVEFFPTPRNSNEKSQQLAAKYYLQQQLVLSYFSDRGIPISELTPDYLHSHLSEIDTWYQQQLPKNKDDKIFSQDTKLVFRYYKGDSLNDDETTELGDILGDYYCSESLSDFYNLELKAPDLTPKDNSQFVQETNIYKGYSPLSNHASVNLKWKLAAYLNEQLDLGQSDPEAYLDQNIDSETNSYKETKQFTSESSDADKAEDPVYSALRAYKQLLSLNGLSQTLSGFNDGLITYHRVMQLPVADPLEGAAYEGFTESVVQQGIEKALSRAPYANKFNPIRGGMMRLLNLRIIDCFGQVIDLKSPNSQDILTSEPLTSSNRDYPVFLPPRLTQPAQLKFQYLSAADGTQEVNNLPMSSPICGWLLPNNLDNSLMVYDTQGQGLGFINYQALWQPMPGSAEAVDADNISHLYLQRVMSYLLNQGSSFIEPFLSALDNSLERIAPENFAQHQGLALLMGKPIAVVRAMVDLKVQGAFAVAHNQKAMARDLDPYLRSTNGFETVKFPIRIGEYQQFNDGLVGYWLEDGQGNYENNIFYAPQSQTVNNELIKTHADGELNLQRSLNDPAQTLTMLMDPRGTVHATSGILPTQLLSLQPDHYSKALQNIEIVFSTAPVLTEVGKVEINLPKEPGYVWSWLKRDRGNWSTSRDFSPMEMKAAFSGKQELIGGWLELSKDTSS